MSKGRKYMFPGNKVLDEEAGHASVVAYDKERNRIAFRKGFIRGSAFCQNFYKINAAHDVEMALESKLNRPMLVMWSVISFVAGTVVATLLIK